MIALIAFALAMLGTLVLEKFAYRLGMLDLPSSRIMQTQPIPRNGGLVVFFTPLLICLALSVAFPGYLGFTAAIVFLGGLLDDIRPANSAYFKMAFQLPAAIAFALWMDINFLQLGQTHELALRFLIFGFVFVMTNSFNLMDNMNGLTSGLSLLIFTTLIALSSKISDLNIFVLPMLLLGVSLFAFFLRNFPKGRIFLGDQGSQFLGFILSSSACVIFSKAFSTATFPVAKTILAVSLLFSLFIFDTLSVIMIRLREKRSIMQGDQCHISHRLARTGLGPTKAVSVLILIQALFIFSVLGLVF